MNVKIERALISVSDKRGLCDFARALSAAGYEILSTSGTKKELLAAGIPVTAIEDYTGAPEILGGRVKTLHPKIHGGILWAPELDSHGVEPIALVAANLYPFHRVFTEKLPEKE